MKKVFVTLLIVISGLTLVAREWKPITSSTPGVAKVTIVETDGSSTILNYQLPGFFLRPVTTSKGLSVIVDCEGLTPRQEAGTPDIPQMAVSLMVPDGLIMNTAILTAEYTDYQGILIAPSKGAISRETDPSKVPFTFGPVYSEDKFYPEAKVSLREPHQIREFRGQTILFTPFQYNPVTKILRVYYNVTVKYFSPEDQQQRNAPLLAKDKKVNRSLLPVLSRHFINFDATNYTAVDDYGNLLVICHTPWINEMQPYVDWKRASGYPTEIVSTDSTGTSASQIKLFIENYYNTKGLTHVLLVGDKAQIPTNNSTGLGGPSDNAYGYIVGTDHYSDAFIGRFSAENAAQVQTQVQRTLDYEINPQFLTDDWFTTVIGIASDQGPGDDQEMDYEHVRNQQSQLLGYKYTWNPELFDGSQGGNDASGNPTPPMVATEVNNGAGLILYTGHGSNTSWGSSGFSNNNVNQLTNAGKLPFIWSVACVNGNFLNGTCFAEAWLRASQNGQPTGAIAFLGSTINQSWDSPMEGQDEMTDILAESYPNNIKRTFAGISISGCMKMIDSYGMDGQNMADTWMVFGDPTVMVRTSVPAEMAVNHDTVVYTGDSALLVTCTTSGARATLSAAGLILATGIVTNDTLLLTFPALTNVSDTLHLVVTAYNTIPYQQDIVVDEMVILPVTAHFTAVPERVLPGETVAFTDTSTGTRVSWAWAFPGGTPDSSTEQNPVVTYNERGIYDATLIVGNGITFDTLVKSGYITCDFPTGLPTAIENSRATISPNPGNGIFLITLPGKSGTHTLEIFNLTGMRVFETSVAPGNEIVKQTIDVSYLPSGIYFVKISGKEGINTLKLVIR